MNDAARPRRRLRPALLTLTAIVAVAAAGGFGWQHWSAANAKGPDYVFATVQRVDLEDLVSATGSLQPRDYVDVGAQVSGQLRKIHVEVGNDVTEGQLLAEIDAEQSAARVEASQANLRAQGAQLAQNQVNLEKAERDLQRQKNLMSAEATTLELVQNADTTVKTTRAQINTLKAQMEQTQASMRIEAANLKYTKIFAPMAGTVVSITAKQGQTLNTNQSAPTILRIADQSTMTIQTQVSEADVSKLRTGMQAYFTTLGSQGRRWYGQLKKVEPTPTVTNNVVLYNALFDVANANRSLMSQMTAQVFFVVSEARDTLVVPMSALTMQRAPQGRRDPSAGAPATPAASAASASASAAAPATAAAPAPEPANASPPGERRRPGGEERQRGAGPSDEQRQRLRAQRQEGAQGTAGARGPRKATVKVAAADGSIAEREVTVGVSNRVQAQILSGLEEGERVVAGLKQADTPRRAAAAQAPGFGAPPGMGAGAPTGGARR
ncbi:MAG: efflux RND transporter periplasmic adaptor subunit [Variovorax sp.]|nr:MAG: efflux RND transporter periplasmic adaptor subunit [Variovorax sp.]